LLTWIPPLLHPFLQHFIELDFGETNQREERERKIRDKAIDWRFAKEYDVQDCAGDRQVGSFGRGLANILGAGARDALASSNLMQTSSLQPVAVRSRQYVGFG
jgi:hypothetical protein